MDANAPHKRRRIGTLVRLAISLILIACIVWWLGGLGKIATIVERISFGLALVVVLLATLDRALMTLKWLWLLKAKGVHAGFFPAMRIYCASMIWGMFLPTTVGADTIRAVSMTRTGLNANEVVASIVIERFFGFFCALLLGLCSLFLLSASGFFESRFTILWWAALAIILSAIIALAASFSERVFHLIHDQLLGRFQKYRLAEKLRSFHTTYRAYRNKTRSLVTFSFLTFAEQLLTVVQTWAIAWALGIHVGIFCFLVALPLTLLVSRIPLGIDGLGTFEATFAFLLSLGGIPAVEAVAIAFTGRILQILSWLPWWIAHVFPTRSLRPPQIHSLNRVSDIN